MNPAHRSPEPVRIRLASTFTATPLAEVLEFWGDALGWELEAAFAPYGQVFQELLATRDGTESPRPAARVLLLRLDDWLSEGTRLSDAAADLAAAVRTTAAHGGDPVVVLLCPSPPGGAPEAVRAAEELLVTALRGVPRVQVVPSAQVLSGFPESGWHAPYTDRLGAVPYTESGFAALGTAVARAVHAWVAPRPKVIAVDCDNTLWDGEIAEGGITVPPARRELQRMLVDQTRAGRLVCLCTRNDEADVLGVLRDHPDMILRPEHVLAVRANWRPKSENLRSLAAELDLGLDTFLFLDDDPLQVAEVRAATPEVTALHMPADAGAAAAFLEHCWPLDAPQVTAEDARRTAGYRDNHRREEVRLQSATLADFLDRLELVVTVRPLAAPELDRAAQLTQRTTQFNLSGVRRTAGEIAALADRGTECLVVDVRDRFGTYGIVGLMLFGARDGALCVDTFLLSCRSTGRGVEHRMLAHLGRLAEERGLAEIRLPYVPTARNVPAADFLEEAGGGWEACEDGRRVRVLSAGRAAGARHAPDRGTPRRDAPVRRAPIRPAPGGRAARRDAAELVHRTAEELATPAQVVAAVRAWRTDGGRHVVAGSGAVPPRTPLEARVLRCWEELLSPRPFSVHDDFFALDGDSLKVVQFLGWVYEEFGVELPAGVWSEGSLTAADAAAAIEEALRPAAVPAP